MHGREVSPIAPNAARWCLLGALDVELLSLAREPALADIVSSAEQAIFSAAAALQGKAWTLPLACLTSLAGFNDHPRTTKARVIRLLELAVSRV